MFKQEILDTFKIILLMKLYYFIGYNRYEFIFNCPTVKNSKNNLALRISNNCIYIYTI